MINKNTIGGTSFGTIGKIYLEFTEPFLPANWNGLTLLQTEEDLNEIRPTESYLLESNFALFYTIDYQPNVLCGRVYGPRVHCMELLDDDAIINGCTMIFKKKFKPIL